MEIPAVLTVLVLLVVVGGLTTGIVATQSLDDDELSILTELTGETAVGNADTDDDGLQDGEELEAGTDPTNADTDADGLLDGEEVERGSDPTVADTDEDGLLDGEEVERGTDPQQADTDGDGVTDGTEVNQYNSDPTSTDTDSDSLSDGAEINTYGTDPSAADTDEDGLSDATEVSGETSATDRDTDSDGVADGVEVNDLETDPTIADSDGDGLTDGEEHTEIGSSPTDADTDGDSLSDGDEVNQYGTDPLEQDTDSDGLDDDYEVSSAAVDPTVADTDTDLLDDGAEIDAGTDPSNADTDGDGFVDGVELSEYHVMDDADPLRKDVFVEVDYTSPSLEPSPQSYLELRNAFDQAPVRNPNGEDGINLHLMGQGTPELTVSDSLSIDEYQSEVYRNSDVRETTGHGFYHILIVEDIEDQSANTNGITYGTGGMIVEKQDPPYTGATMMHELGHNLGLSSQTYVGIDNTVRSWDAYPSVMNYNRPQSCNIFFGIEYGCEYDPSFVFSAGTGHDDWGHIDANLARNIPDTSDIRQIAAAE